mgnify:CR=1 FL=1
MFTDSPIVASPSWTTYETRVWLPLHPAPSSSASSRVSFCWQLYNLIKKKHPGITYQFVKVLHANDNQSLYNQHCEGNWQIKAVYKWCRKEDYYSHCISILWCPSYPETSILASESFVDLGICELFLILALYCSKRPCQWRRYCWWQLISTNCFCTVLVPWANDCNNNRKTILLNDTTAKILEAFFTQSILNVMQRKSNNSV